MNLWVDEGVEIGHFFDSTAVKGYHYWLMSVQDLPYIDSLRFAKEGEIREGYYAIAALPRLAKMLAAPEGDLHYRLEGRIELGRPQLCLTVQALLSLDCQRCLQPMQQDLQLRSYVCVARNEAELLRWDAIDLESGGAMVDAVLVEARMSVQDFVEDEVLLGLPVAFSHPEGECPESLSGFVGLEAGSETS